MEAAPGVEPGDKGFAILCLTAWLCRHVKASAYLNTWNSIMKDKTTQDGNLSVDKEQIMLIIIQMNLSISKHKVII